MDQKGLEEECFSYQVCKDKKVLIFWYGKQVMTLKGKDCEKFLARVGRGSPRDAQLVMAKVTGNFKRGNEKGSCKGSPTGLLGDR